MNEQVWLPATKLLEIYIYIYIVKYLTDTVLQLCSVEWLSELLNLILFLSLVRFGSVRFGSVHTYYYCITILSHWYIFFYCTTTTLGSRRYMITFVLHWTWWKLLCYNVTTNVLSLRCTVVHAVFSFTGEIARELEIK
jgi:hypothetical protein